jgi:copper chaperone
MLNPSAMAATDTVLHVRGMSCGSCVRHVEEAVRSVPGVLAVTVDLAGGTVRISHADADLEAIAQAIDEAGYEVGVQASVPV